MAVVRTWARRWRLVRAGRQAAGFGLAAALVVVLGQSTTSASFTASTGDAGNQVTAATDFCSASSSTVTATEDTNLFESSPEVAAGSGTSLSLISAPSANTWLLLRFTPMPVIQPGCVVTGATLSLYASGVTSGRVIEVSRADPAAPLWAESTARWSTRPQPVDSPVPSNSLLAANWQTWNVTPLMAGLYAGPNNGFLIRDQAPSANPSKSQVYVSREGTATQIPKLTVSWG